MREKERREARGIGFTQIQLNEGETHCRICSSSPRREKKRENWKIKGMKKRDGGGRNTEKCKGGREIVKNRERKTERA